ncbi:MAG: hypothetical protein M0P13_07125 [Fibrobacteraceae bacterium]|nr:hypothetical protein [Fibrobacteraceae bacterium]
MELMAFFGEGARIVPNLQDLREFLAPRRLYKVVKISESSFEKCAYALVDNFPECTRALGMLRYYRSPGEVYWEDIERAENIIAESLTMDVYGWEPDAFTLFETAEPGHYELVAILAF